MQLRSTWHEHAFGPSASSVSCDACIPKITQCDECINDGISQRTRTQMGGWGVPPLTLMHVRSTSCQP
jgi:hypothetical protein